MGLLRRTGALKRFGAPEYARLNGLVAIATGERCLRKVIITVYEGT